MFNLIIVLISVALIIGLTIVTVFYAGDIVSESKTKAVAATFDNQASQIYSASLLYYQDKGTWPVDVSLLYLEGKKYLSAEISPPATMADRVKSAIGNAFAQTMVEGEIINGSTALKPYVGDATAFMATMVQNKALTEKRLNKIKAVIGDDPVKLAYIAGMYNETPKAGELKKTDWAWSDDSDIPSKRYVKVSGKVAEAVCKHVNVRSGKAANSDVEVHKVFDPNFKIQCFGAAEPYTYLFLTPEADPQVINSDPPPESLCSDGVSRRDGYGHCPCPGKPWYPLANGACPDSWKVTLVAPNGVCNNPTTSLSGKVSCPPGGGAAGGSTMQDYGGMAADELPVSAGPSGGGPGSCPLMPAGSTMIVVTDGVGEAYLYEGPGSNHKFPIDDAQVCKCEDGSLPVKKGAGDNRYAVCNPEKDPVAGSCPIGYSLIPTSVPATKIVQNGIMQADQCNQAYTIIGSRPTTYNPQVVTHSSLINCPSITSSSVPTPEEMCLSTYATQLTATQPSNYPAGKLSALNWRTDKNCGNCNSTNINQWSTFLKVSVDYTASSCSQGGLWISPFRYNGTWTQFKLNNALLEPYAGTCTQVDWACPAGFSGTVSSAYSAAACGNVTYTPNCRANADYYYCPSSLGAGWTLSGTNCVKTMCGVPAPAAPDMLTDNPVADSPKECSQYASQAALATACHNEEKGLQAYLDGLGSMAAVYQPQIDVCRCEWVEENGCEGGGACTKTAKTVGGSPSDCGPSGFFNQLKETAGVGDCNVQRNVPCGSNGSKAQAVEDFAGAATGTAICTLGNGLKFMLDAMIPSAHGADGPTNRDVCEAMKAFNGAQACRPDSGFLGMKSADNPDTWTKNSAERKRINLCDTQCAGTLNPAQEAACAKLGC